MPSDLKKTPLNTEHRRLGARMVDFEGWEMPVQYPSGILAEHTAVRTSVGLFDLSHMGRVHLRGRDALPLAEVCCTRDYSPLRPGEAAYSVVCNAEGGILDDVIGYVVHDGEIVFVFNASNRVADTAFFTEQRDTRGLDVDIVDLTFETALIGLQGPAAQTLLQRLCSDDLSDLQGYAFKRTAVAEVTVMVSRTGYTGEDGFEVVVPADAAEHVWSAMLLAGAAPCGLGARDTLRTEAGFALYGHEIDQSTNPFEARLGWVVDLTKDDFVGKRALESLKAQPLTRRLVGLLVAPGGVPRADLPIVNDSDQVGRVTSGTFAPTLRANIAMGYVPANLSAAGQRLSVEVRGQQIGADVTKLPFVPHRFRRRATM